MLNTVDSNMKWGYNIHPLPLDFKQNGDCESDIKAKCLWIYLVWKVSAKIFSDVTEERTLLFSLCDKDITYICLNPLWVVGTIQCKRMVMQKGYFFSNALDILM